MYKLNSWNENTNFNVSKIANNYHTVQTACGSEVSTACGSEVVSSACGTEITTACGSERF